MAYREAYTPYAAADAADYLASAFGLRPAPAAEGGSALHGQAQHYIPERGRIVFVYRRSETREELKDLTCPAAAT